MLHVLARNIHIIGYASLRCGGGRFPSMETERDHFVPLSMTLMGVRSIPPQSDRGQHLRAERGIEWFRQRHHQGAVSASA